MTTVLDASDLSLRKVLRYLKFQEQFTDEFASLLALKPLNETEQQRLEEIRNTLKSYYQDGNILEGEIKFLFLSPLMWLSGFYHPNIRISLEEGIQRIDIQAEDIQIKGRMDILAAKREDSDRTALWILLIESKRATADIDVGLPQLLTYAYRCLDQQDSVWGLTTNGKRYQFVYIQQGKPPTYTLLPELSLLRPGQANQILQVMKAICQPFLMG